MHFVGPTLQSALAAWRQDPDVREPAKADNAWFEERVSTARLASFEGEAGDVTDPAGLLTSHTRYVRDFMETDVGIPHTFMADLEPAALSPSGLDPHQSIIRLESLQRAFSYWPMREGPDPLETLRAALDRDDTAVINGFLRTWNESNVRDFRPAFAAWKDEMLTELDAEDWPDRLRDRLGLEHYNCAAGPIPVALMEYRVQDVLDAARAAGVTHAFTAPTFLDTRPGPYFFPSPRSLPYGRVMSLARIASDDDLLAEMLHLRLTYRREHIARVGTISRPPVSHNLKDLRNHHLTGVADRLEPR